MLKRCEEAIDGANSNDSSRGIVFSMVTIHGKWGPVFKPPTYVRADYFHYVIWSNYVRDKTLTRNDTTSVRKRESLIPTLQNANVRNPKLNSKGILKINARAKYRKRGHLYTTCCTSGATWQLIINDGVNRNLSTDKT